MNRIKYLLLLSIVFNLKLINGQTDSIIDRSFYKIISTDNFDVRLKQAICNLTELKLDGPIGNKNFSDYKIFGNGQFNEYLLTIYAFAYCQNFSYDDSTLNFGKIKSGIVRIEIGNYLSKNFGISTSWTDIDGSKLDYSYLLKKINPYDINNVDTAKIFKNLKNNAVQEAREYFINEGFFKDLGYISKIYEKNQQIYLSIDFVQWLVNDEAIEAAKEDGVNDCCPNGYYIRNKSSIGRTYRVSENVKIINIDTDRKQTITDLVYQGQFKGFLCEIVMKNKSVIEIREWYLP